MATSGNFQKAITSWLNLRVEWVANSQNTATNKTNLTVTAYLVSTASSGVINSSASKTVNLTINGTTYSYSAAGLAKISGSQKKKLFSKTVDVSHNANGTKSCSISCSFGIQVTLSGTYYGTVSTSGTATLNTIPRASSIASISGSTIGSSVTVNITPASSSFTHKVYYKAPNTTSNVLKATLTAGTNSTSFTPALSDCNNIPNATNGTATITLETYSGSTKLGTVTKTFTLNVPSSVVPSISALTVSEAVSGLASKFGVYVQTKSKVAVSITAAGSYSSTIKTITTTLTNGSTVLTYNGASFTSGFLSLAGTYTVKTIVTDSRGRTATKSTTISVVAYYPPQINELIVQRWDTTTNKADDDGKYLHYSVKANVAPVSNKNDKKILFEYRKAGETTWTTLTAWADISAYNYSKSNTYTTPQFSVDDAFEIRVSVKDYFTSSTPATKKADLPTARTVFDILADGTGICFGGVASKGNTCEIAMQSEFTGGQINLNAQDETDLNQFTKPNIYVSKNNATGTYAHLPDGATGTFTLEVMSAGQEGQLVQRLTTCSKDAPTVYTRHYYGGAWGEWVSNWRALANNTNLNNLVTPQNCRLLSNYTYTNAPETGVAAFLEVIGNGTAVTQRVTIAAKTDPRTYERAYYSSAWGEWICTRRFGGTVLWNGQYYMHGTQTAPLSEKVSKQAHGIVLVFSHFDGSAAQDYNFNSFFVPKRLVALKEGKGHSFIMTATKFNNIAVKYLYISDDEIKGHETNDESGTATAGFKYSNNAYVLRYVIGV